MAGLTVRLFSLFSTLRDPLLPGRASFYPVAIGNFNCRTGNFVAAPPQLILVGSKLTWIDGRSPQLLQGACTREVVTQCAKHNYLAFDALLLGIGGYYRVIR